MIARIDAFLNARSTPVLSVIIAMTTAVVAIADFATGPYLSFSIFYMVPVSLASWYAPRAMIALTCLVCTATWLAVELAGIDYPNDLIPLWNAAVRLGFFAITSVLLVALKALLQKQRELADVDGLTGLLNRRAFEDRCGYLFRLADRQDRPVSLGYLDIDRFKTANDDFGHQVGDRILVGVADALGHTLRRSDIVGRLGGDEFAFALPDADFADAQAQSKRLIARLRRAATKEHWPVGFSVGVIVCRPPMPDLLVALNRADALMYAVKKSGTGGFRIEELEAADERSDEISRTDAVSPNQAASQ
ncbi:MAG: diguanylate cyclase [Woeseiaceae bacterium]|nr:diguanylate cyclase [Woeseiaceae bacterium]